MKKTPQSKIDNNIKWAKNNLNKVRQYKRKYKHEQKRLAREHIKSIKEQSGCKICGNKNIHCLDFHHRPRTKKKNTVCNLVRHGYSLKVIKKEIQKCDIICSNCHRTKHFNHNKKIVGIKTKFVYNIKKSNKCSCGCNMVECLDFHHPNKDKEFGIGCMLRDKNVTIDMLQKEIDKCIIICSNCHRILHAEEREAVKFVDNTDNLL